MTTKCPKCARAYDVDASANGLPTRCPVCGENFTIMPVLVPNSATELLNKNIAQNESATVRMLIPVGRSGWAIAAGYLGLFSVLLVFAPIAIFTGVMALRDIRRHPGKHGKGRAWFGIIMGVFVLLVLCAVLMGMAVA